MYRTPPRRRPGASETAEMAEMANHIRKDEKFAIDCSPIPLFTTSRAFTAAGSRSLLTVSDPLPFASGLGCVRWTANQVASIDPRNVSRAPVIAEGDFDRISPDIDIWDAWPIQDEDGNPSQWEGGDTLWMALGAPRAPDPNQRHGVSRIHLFANRNGIWRHLGPAMPDGFSPGSREWSGSALLDADRRALTLYFTAAGHRGEQVPSFGQRLIQARARVGPPGERRFEDWYDQREIVVPDPRFYMPSDQGSGAVGTIKAFRDPAYFRDPVDGRHYLFFAGSQAGSCSAYNGVIGAASAPAANRSAWQLLPPILSADMLNNELERPHMVFRGGLYYLFWSTQAHVFNPEGPIGPTGLYGVASPRIDGGWEPLNDSGLVFANPEAAPKQAYSWLVLPDLSAISFVDQWGSEMATGAPARFGATFAPTLKLELDGLRARLKAPA